MRLTEVELLQNDATMATGSDRAEVACARAKELEEANKYEDARLVLSEFWAGPGERPQLDGLDDLTRGELLLRVGTLSGWLGTQSQTSGAQEIAKDLISESSAIFEKLDLVEKVAEARVDLGICYWREGALEEAKITFDDALQRLGSRESQQRLRALLNKAIVEEVSARSKEAVRILSASEGLFDSSSNRPLKAKFHLAFANALKNLGLAERREDYIDRSLMQYTAAGVFSEEDGNKVALAIVENNLGFLYAHLEKFEEAHEHLDRALSIATSLSAKGLRAQFEDTRARTLLAQGRIEQAEKTAGSSVKGLRGGDEQSNFAVALTTYAVALARLGHHGDALAMLSEAVSVAAEAGDRETGGLASLTIIEELAAVLSPSALRDHYKSAEAALKNSQQPAVQFRLTDCARAVLASDERTAMPGAETLEPTVLNSSLEEQVLRYEGELIKRALQASDGSVTRAARLLGVTHQGLAFILNGRQKNLLPSRKPVKPRRRSIIRYH